MNSGKQNQTSKQMQQLQMQQLMLDRKKIQARQAALSQNNSSDSSGHVSSEGYMSEVAPPGDKYERMVKHIKNGYSEDGKLTDKEKSIAYATAWKQKNKNK